MFYNEIFPDSKSNQTRLDMTQEQLAHELQVSFDTINRWENDKSSPNNLTKSVFYQYCKDKGLYESLIMNIEQERMSN